MNSYDLVPDEAVFDGSETAVVHKLKTILFNRSRETRPL